MVDTQSGASATTNSVTPGREVLRLPEFPDELLVEYWTTSRQHSGKLNTAAYSVRCTLAAMVNMHVHKMGDMRAHDIHTQAEKKYKELVVAFKRKYSNSAVSRFVEFTALTKFKAMDGEKVWAADGSSCAHRVRQSVQPFVESKVV